MHWNRILTGTVFLSLGLLTLLLIGLSQEPLCIDSKVVEKINRSTLGEPFSESVFRCLARKRVPYSSYFAAHLPQWADRIHQTERFLESIEPFYRKVHITIVPQQGLFFQVHNHQIRIGEDLLASPGHLERALIKVWYRERSRAEFASSQVVEEAMVDLIYFAQTGSLDISDTNKVLDWKKYSNSGVFALQSRAAYCESPWRKTEHYLLCTALPADLSSLAPEHPDLSLRPLLSQSLIASYLSLSGAERYQLFQGFAEYLRSERTIVFYEKGGQKNVSAILGLAQHLKNSQIFVTEARAVQGQEVFLSFAKAFQQQLNSKGYYDATIEATFDYLFVSHDVLNQQSSLLESLQKYAKENSQQQIAVRDPHALWILPSGHPLPVDSLSPIKAKRAIVQICGAYNFSYVLGYVKDAEKLLVVSNCGENQKIDYDWYLKGGVEAFSVHNPQVRFVQYHLPSLAMRSLDLKDVKSVEEFLQSQDLNHLATKSLGWRYVSWDQAALAYRPKAVIDGIEWFRVTTVPGSKL